MKIFCITCLEEPILFSYLKRNCTAWFKKNNNEYSIYIIYEKAINCFGNMKYLKSFCLWVADHKKFKFKLSKINLSRMSQIQNAEIIFNSSSETTTKNQERILKQINLK